MKIAILSESKNLYSTNSLYEAALRRGHEVIVVNHKNVQTSWKKVSQKFSIKEKH